MKIFPAIDIKDKEVGGWWAINKATGEITYLDLEITDEDKQELLKEVEDKIETIKSNKPFKRCFDEVEETFRGKKTDLDLLASVGYLMRTTAVYGSGKFGCADREIEAMVMGGHGDTMVPLPRFTKVSGKPLLDLVKEGKLSSINSN